MKTPGRKLFRWRMAAFLFRRVCPAARFAQKAGGRAARRGFRCRLCRRYRWYRWYHSCLLSPPRQCCSCSFRITDILSDPACLTGILSGIPLCRRSFRQSGSRSFSLPLHNLGAPLRRTEAQLPKTKKPTCQKASRFPVGKTTPKLYGSLLDQPPFAAALLALLALPVLGVTGLPIWDSAVLIWGSSATAVSRMVAFWLSVSADSRSGVMP